VSLDDLTRGSTPPVRANLTLRSASVNDVEALFRIRCSVTENHQSREELAILGVTVASIREMIEKGDYVTTIAEKDKQPVGFTMAQVSEGYVFACFVRPNFESQGIGRALMNAAEEGLRSADVKKAWLSTGPGEDLRAVGFYRRLGWVHGGYLEDGQIKFTKNLQEAEQTPLMGFPASGL
jgi:ribosomal protein S18 acetylase RimI-like enzyme